MASARIRSSAAVVDFLATTEMYLSQRYTSAVQGATEGQVKSWHSREQRWTADLGADFVTGLPEWKQLRGFVEARNAVQHGGGQLTEQQTGKYVASLMDQLAAAEITMHGDRVVLDEESVDRCYRLCTTTIRYCEALI